MTKRFLPGLLAMTAALMAAVQSPCSLAQADGASLPGPWPTYKNGYDGQRFSPGEAAKKDAAHVADFIKNPKSPMPKLYPAPLNEKDVADVAAFVEVRPRLRLLQDAPHRGSYDMPRVHLIASASITLEPEDEYEAHVW